MVLSPGSSGVLPDAHPQNMHVGGSKGSISGNAAMAAAELVVVVGSRAVCQSDCSGIGYPAAKAVVNINGDLTDLLHYNATHALPGDISAVCNRLAAELERIGAAGAVGKAEWLAECAAHKAEWAAFRAERFAAEPVMDETFGRPVLSQPAAIKVVADFARRIGAAKLFDAGDVQANGFQIVEDDRTGDTFTETGASYMGFAVSALLASGLAEAPRYTIAFTGDGSFMMNPQILIDAIEHGVRGMVVIFDNRRMAAISSLQVAQYGATFKTHDAVAVDYAALAGSVAGVLALHGGFTADRLTAALARAYAHDGFSVVHVPVHAGDDPLAGLGAWGNWKRGQLVRGGPGCLDRAGPVRGGEAIMYGYDDFGLFIGGGWRAASARGTRQVVDPATEEVIGRVPDATDDDIDAALVAAAAGLRHLAAGAALGQGRPGSAESATSSASASSPMPCSCPWRRASRWANPVASGAPLPTSSNGTRRKPSGSTARPSRRARAMSAWRSSISRWVWWPRSPRGIFRHCSQRARSPPPSAPAAR